MPAVPTEVLKHIRRIQVETNRLAEDILVGMYHSAFKGKGIEFEEVREYQRGDDVRDIDWKVTARMNEPYIKVFREERQLTVMLLVDISPSQQFGSRHQLKREVIAEIGALLAFTVVSNADKVGLILFSDKVEHYLPPKRGVRHVLRVIRDLLIFEAKGSGTAIQEALAFLGRVQKRPTVCFLISDFMGDLVAQDMTIASKKHDLIAVRITDPAETTLPDMGLVTFRDLESGAFALIDTTDKRTRKDYQAEVNKKRLAVADLIKKIGAGLIEINTNASYVEPLRKFFKMRRIRH